MQHARQKARRIPPSSCPPSAVLLGEATTPTATPTMPCHARRPILLNLCCFGGGGGVVPVAAMVAPTTSDGVAGQTVALIMVSTRDINAAKLAAK